MKVRYQLALLFLIAFGIAATAAHGPFAIRDTAPSLTFTDTNGDDFDVLVDGDAMTFRNRDAGGGTTDYAVVLPASAGTLALSSYVDSLIPTLLTLPLRAQWFVPTAADDNILLTLEAPLAATITEINCYSWGGTTTITISNGASFTSTNVTDAGGLACATDSKTTDSSLTNTAIAAGSIVAVDISAIAGTPARVHVELK